MKGYGMDYSMKIVKEIYKSQVYCVKTRLLLTLHSKIGDKHGYSKSDKGKIVIDPCRGRIDNKRFWGGDAVSAGTCQSSQPSCAPRRTAKIAKGKYYIPKKTIFGNLKPADSELVKDFLEQNGKIVGYITGTAAFASLGLTTQISSSILVGTNKYRRPITRNGVKISFLLQENAITSSNIPLLRILDALRLIKDIPATSPDECVTNICKAINTLSMEQKQELAELSLAYTPYVRALLGAIYENMGLETETISKTLNGVTSYKLPVSDKVLSNKKTGTSYEIT